MPLPDPSPALPPSPAPLPSPASPPSAAPPPSPGSTKRRKWSRRKKILVTVAVVVLLVLTGVTVVSWQAGQALLHPKRDGERATPSSMNLTWEWANFTTSDGVPIVGWWMPAEPGAANGTVIFLHGYSDAKAQGLPMFPMLHNQSVNVLAFDFRAHGQSGGAYTTAGLLEVHEVDAAIAWVMHRTGDGENRTVLLGWSMGAAAAINAAPSHPDLAGVIADASFSRLHNIVDTSIGKFTGLPRWPFGPLAVQFASWNIGININDNAPAEAVARYHGPLLLIQGLNDTTVLPANVDELAAAAPQAEVWRVPNAEHTECYKTDPDGYKAHVTAFLAAVLAAR